MVEEEQPNEEAAGEQADPSGGPFVGASEAPELLIDGFQGVVVHNGLVKINLYTVNMDPAQLATYRKIAAKLCMSIPTLIQVHAALGNVLSDLERDGLIKRVPGSSDGDKK